MSAVAGRPGLRAAARALLLAAVFIIVSAHVADGRQCYWCGPLAEQVHRSRRAAPCEGGDRHITVCEPGYDHCAVVATSPPYLESRFCVKLYQDECYPLFCNSTKTWKMTCPCRGDLCNGANTQREEDAFSVLAKLLKKTHSHIKKRTPTLQLTGNRKGRIVSPKPQDEQVRPAEEDQNADVVTENALMTNTDSTNNQSTTIDQPSNEKYDDIIHSTSEKIGSNADAKPTTTVMIEIDIIQTPAKFHHESIATQTAMHEIDIQADEQMQNDDPGEIQQHNGDINEDHKVESQLEDIKPDVSTIDPLKHSSEDSIATSLAPPPKGSINSEDKIEPHEATVTDPAQKEEIQTQSVEKNPQISQTIVEVPMSSTEGVTTVRYAVTGGTTAIANTTQSSKVKKNSDAIKLSINTLIIIYCILLCIII